VVGISALSSVQCLVAVDWATERACHLQQAAHTVPGSLFQNRWSKRVKEPVVPLMLMGDLWVSWFCIARCLSWCKPWKSLTGLCCCLILASFIESFM